MNGAERKRGHVDMEVPIGWDGMEGTDGVSWKTTCKGFLFFFMGFFSGDHQGYDFTRLN